MEKLIELINKYKEEKNILNTDTDGQLEIGKYIYVNYPCAERLCSKNFGFIKRLIENDKIDYEKCIKEFMLKDFRKFYYISKADNVIANLSIKDNPIEFLISLLK